MAAFNGVKVFSATMVADRDRLGERAGEWVRDKIANVPGFVLEDITTTQSSDHAFHCIALTVFYTEPAAVVPGRRLNFK